jgi:thiamine biosynthesis lipoprotein
MGSEVRLTAWTADEPGAVRAFELAFREFERLDRLLSVWQPGSDVVRLNAAAGGAPLKVASDTLEVLRQARQVGEWTGGKFDVTFGALSGLWKFDHDQDDRIPAAADVRARLPLVDFRAVEVDAASGMVALRRPGMALHLGGIGKGYAVDRAAAILRARGIDDFLIQSGGDLYAAGRRGDRAWRAGIQDPRGPADQVFVFVHDGRRYHHILDPDDGAPARGCRSVTIVAKRAVLADALSTGVFVLGPRKGMALVEQLPDVEGVVVTSSNEVLVSSGLTERLEWLRRPTDAP